MVQKKKRTNCDKLKDLIARFDIFGADMDALYNVEAIKLFKTVFGAVLTVIFLSILINYTIYKYE